VRESSNPQQHARSAYVPAEFHDAADVAERSLEEQLEQLQRRYAAATRAVSKARFELELLEGRDDVHPHMISQAKRQKAAAETRAAQLLRQIDDLEDRLEEA
jgi:chromosome segregation ATPase